MTVSFEIKNSQVLTDVFLKKILISIDSDETNDFTLKFHFDSVMDNSKLAIIGCGEREIKFTRYGENNNSIKMEGERQDILDFIKLILVHSTMIVSFEICNNLFSDEIHTEFLEYVKTDVSNAIIHSFESCQRTID